MTHTMANTENLLHYFLMTEGWAITALVLLYVIWVNTLPKPHAVFRIVVPLIISVAAHLVMRGLGHHVEWARCISDMGYDWLAPVGMYHIGAEIVRFVRKALTARKNKR